MQGSAAALRSTVLREAHHSFSYFVRAVLGRRGFAEARLDALAVGAALPSPKEAPLLAAWQQLRAGELPAALQWLGSSARGLGATVDG